MKRIGLLGLGLLFFVSSVFGRDIKGVVTAGQKALSGVWVTDGYSIVESDKKGNYKLELNPAAEFVSVIQPSGYMVPVVEGVPCFYISLKEKRKSYDFDLTPLANAGKYALIVVADVQTQTDRHFARFREESIPDIEKQIKSYDPGTTVVGLSLGDIVWDNFEHFPLYKKEMQGLGIPFFQVIGNHDHDKNTVSEAASENQYKAAFGPTYYAFGLGEFYYIVLDNVVYEGNKVYTNTVDRKQLDWLEVLLKRIPKGSEIVLAMHVPLFDIVDKSGGTQSAPEISKLLEGYNVNVLSGHTHINVNFISDGIFEHNITGLGGSWWATDISKDGTPNGYQVFEADGKRLEWFFKSVGKSRDYQMALYPRGFFKQHINSVVAKVWNYDPEWRIEWFEDGKAMGAMQNFESTDPVYVKFAKKNKVKSYKDPRTAKFYFHATPSQFAREVKVVATDRFGRKYQETIKLDAMNVEAHRGGIGLMPENTIDAMKNAIDLGVNTLEMDMAVSKDRKVLVSHDPYMNYKFVTKPDGSQVAKEESKSLALYKMPYDSIRRYETGLKPHPDYPGQKKLRTYKPLMSELIDSVENYVQRKGLSPMYYNIEVKSSAGNDNVYSPVYTEFVDLAMDVLLSKGITDRMVVQCFDIRALNYMHKKYPQVKLSYLVGAKDSDFEANMGKLDFVPEVYSPHFSLVNEELIGKVHGKGMRILPWTVDKKEDIEKMVNLKVDGVISNYPDRVLQQVRKY